jgi:PHS family inorganic phosphate transporter-like MFS transporter
MAETASHSYSNEGKGDAPYTLEERRRAALEEIDSASFSWFHVKVAAVAGVGFMTDA